MKSLIVIPISVPAGVTEDTLLAEVPIPRGRIEDIHVDIPAGIQFLAGFRVENNRRQIIPILSFGDDTEPAWIDRYITGDSSEIKMKIDIPIEEGTLEIYGINFGDVEARFILILGFRMEEV